MKILAASLPFLLLLASTSGPWVVCATGAASGLPDGSTCYYDKNYTPMKPLCKRDFGCLVTKVVKNSPRFLFKGKCASDVPIDQINQKYCMFRSVMFAPGTSGITASTICPRCTCQKLKSGPTCVCPLGKLCKQDAVGRWKGGTRCKDTRQNQCEVSRFVNDTYIGNCIKSAQGPHECVSAGPGWGPIFVKNGAHNMTKAGDLCQRCSCIHGKFVNCKPVPGCVSKC
ncbi:unnamed protein product [Closterium sp. Naga37s-1]|nr:unnamed protein product [Closterium sp. Naga37s-1]